jgi:hypothetical protein
MARAGAPWAAGTRCRLPHNPVSRVDRCHGDQRCAGTAGRGRAAGRQTVVCHTRGKRPGERWRWGRCETDAWVRAGWWGSRRCGHWVVSVSPPLCPACGAACGCLSAFTVGHALAWGWLLRAATSCCPGRVGAAQSQLHTPRIASQQPCVTREPAVYRPHSRVTAGVFTPRCRPSVPLLVADSAPFHADFSNLGCASRIGPSPRSSPVTDTTSLRTQPLLRSIDPVVNRLLAAVPRKIGQYSPDRTLNPSVKIRTVPAGGTATGSPATPPCTGRSWGCTRRPSV